MSEKEIANNVAVLAGALAADNTTPALRQAAAAAAQALVTQLLIDIHRIATPRSRARCIGHERRKRH